MPVSLPRVQVLVGNAVLPGAVAVEIEQVGYFAADRFALTMALDEGGAAYFASLGLQTVNIGVAVSPAGYVDMLTGQIDNIRIDLCERIAVLCGRDLSARLIDTEISETFANQTASQIAAAIAARHGLTPNVTPTLTPVGQYYELDHARNALAANSRTGTEWKMLSFLAQAENFVLSVVGSTLNFGPVVAGVPVLLTPEACIALDVDIATTIPAQATVKSWNTRNKMVVAETAGADTGGATTLVRPNLTSAQANVLATNHLSVLMQHGTRLRAVIPGETALTPAAMILLSGTESALDQVYVIDRILRSIDAREGFVESIEAHALAG